MPVFLPGQTDIYALTDAHLSCGRTLETVVSALLGAGVKIIQYREKHMKSGEMLEECRLMRRLTREHCDELISIPMAGSVSSLNVSVATGICLFEAVRQRS